MMTTQPGPAPYGIDSIRIVAAHKGGFAQVAHLSWARPPGSREDDSSLYIRPFVGDGWTAYGSVNRDVAPNSTTEVQADRHRNAKFGELKMSLHGSGQTHVFVGPHRHRYRLPPVNGRALHDPAGGHLATITSADLTGLPLLARPLSATPPDIEFVAPGPGEGTAQLKVVLYVGTNESAMRERYPFLANTYLIRFDRPGLPNPVFFGMNCPHVPGPRKSTPGVRVVGGWGPGAKQDEPIPVVSIWAAPDESTP
ncbi:hypothetical protein [Streptomyces lavendulae]|uniref:hypothetical protein n=1 Tax=Streptomyces lavendulae TaxID=1914 RepID=UPI002555ACF8|nr:hypothetical protein [Streptomyces lavendulae]